MKLPENMLPPMEVDVSRLPSKGRTQKFTASDEERQKLCGAFGLLSLDLLQADIRIAPWRRGGIELKGQVIARLTQPCVVTLEPVQQNIDEEVSTVFLPEGSPLARPKIDKDGEMVIDPEGADLPETFSGTVINVSDVIVEVLALAIDPHPRCADATLATDYTEITVDEQPRQSPFAVLGILKTGKSDG